MSNAVLPTKRLLAVDKVHRSVIGNASPMFCKRSEFNQMPLIVGVTRDTIWRSEYQIGRDLERGGQCGGTRVPRVVLPPACC